jgi:hypothetical protein
MLDLASLDPDRLMSLSTGSLVLRRLTEATFAATTTATRSSAGGQVLTHDIQDRAGLRWGDAADLGWQNVLEEKR